MSYFHFNKKTNEVWLSPESDENHFTDVRDAIVTFKSGYYVISQYEDRKYTVWNEKSFLISGNIITKKPCSVCKFNLTRMFSSEDCHPCNFEYEDKIERAFNSDILCESLMKKGYIRTNEKMFLFSTLKK